jgi:hypothetical protein
MAFSDNQGGHWPFADWVMTRKDGVIMPTFCNYSRNYNGARDDYLYIYLIRFQSDEGQDDYPDKVAWLNCQNSIYGPQMIIQHTPLHRNSIKHMQSEMSVLNVNLF